MDRRRNVSSVAAAAAKVKRCNIAKLHFRAAVRLAYENHYWLEDTEGQQLGMNVAKNIQILTRKKRKGDFSLKERALMKVSQEKRTEEEKHILRRVLATMKCFRKYPSEVKKDLAAITYYAEYDADRIIVRQGDDARALYFVISGTARVLLTKTDPLTGEITEEIVKVKEAGDLFGELALLIGSKRSATIVTNEKSEFLFVKREDFDLVLKDSVLREWNEIKKAMGMFEYFKTWSDRYIQESCMVSKMRYYDQYALILSDECGDKRNVYFLIEGSVDLLECVEMKVTTLNNKKTYSLYNPYDSDQRGKSLTVDLTKFFRDLLATGKSVSDVELMGQDSKKFSFGSGNFEDYLSRSLSKLRSIDYMKKKARRCRRSVVRKHSARDVKVLTDLSPAERVNYIKQHESRLSRVTCLKEQSVTTLETHFMRVAKMGPLGTFNIGEHLDSRFYVSRTKIKLLAIPQYWLFSKNKATWNNISIFLRSRLPTRNQLFEQFKMKQRWLKYRQDCYFDIAGLSQKANVNSINNVPLSLRLNEDFDFYISSIPFPSKTE